jgi:hypothetical protein
MPITSARAVAACVAEHAKIHYLAMHEKLSTGMD